MHKLIKLLLQVSLNVHLLILTYLV